MDKFSTLASPNYKNFVAGFKRFIRSGMGSLSSIMALKNHFGFKYVHDNRFPGQSKDKVFVFKMSVDIAGSGIDLVKRMQYARDMENSWIMFVHVKHLRDWTTMVCYVYDSKHYKVLTITCCDMQSEDAWAQTIFWENLNVVMLENGVPNVNFKGFMADSAQANWIDARKIYRDGDPSVPLEGHEHACFFHWSTNLDKITQKHIWPSLQHEHKQIYAFKQIANYHSWLKGGSSRKGPDQASLKLKTAAHTGDPKLLAEAMRLLPAAEDLNTRKCALEGSEFVWINQEETRLTTWI